MTPSSFGSVLEQRHCHAYRISESPPNRLTVRSLHQCERMMGALPPCGILPHSSESMLADRRNTLTCIMLSVNIPFLPMWGELGQHFAHPIERLAVHTEDLGRFRDVSLRMGEHARHVTVLQIVQSRKVVRQLAGFGGRGRLRQEEIAGIDDRIGGQRQRALDEVLQLADVAGEWV